MEGCFMFQWGRLFFRWGASFLSGEDAPVVVGYIEMKYICHYVIIRQRSCD